MSDEEEDTSFELLGFPRSSDDADLRSRDPVEVLASQFAEEMRAGKRPSVESWARRFPPHAKRIREYFPVLAMLEQARSDDDATNLRRHMPESLPIRFIGGCEILCELGRGGMGVVYQARETSSGHIVAIKVLPWRVSIVPEWQQQFTREAQTVAKLKHPNIVPVFRFGQEQGYCFFVMQYVNGIGMDRLVTRLTQTDSVVLDDERQLLHQSRPEGFVASHAGLGQSVSPSRRQLISRYSWSLFIRLIVQAAQALQHAHESGIVHNDIKPGNLLLDAQSRVWVTDFGVAQPLNSLHPVQDNAAGTLRFMAPERFHQPGDVRSDIYALGMTLYEICLQSPAFTDAEAPTAARPLPVSPPVAPRKRCPQIPGQLEQTILNCIAFDPQHRYPSANALQADLLKCASGQSVASIRPGLLSGWINAFRNPREDDTA
jgi:serine/threonine protein kinase